MSGMEPIGGVIRAGFIPTGARHPVIRSGERQPIADFVRAAVWYRDRGCCELCGTRRVVDGPWHLDHITPWSAGGSDDSTNLRVLCERHNMDRGNRVDPTERPRRPVTWWCLRCWSPPLIDQWQHVTTGTSRVPTVCPVHTMPERCRVIRGYRRTYEVTGEWPDWHMAGLPVEGSNDPIAYCAHCNAPGMTGILL